jgi:ABC-type bacteriocin/lantibiotic exporter with double-glycine peptidase domain
MRQILKIFDLMSRQEKKRAIILMILILIMSVFDMLGIISIYPFLLVLTNPELIETNAILRNLFDFVNLYGINSEKKFLIFLGIFVFFIFIFSLSFKGVTNYFLLRFVMMREYSIGRRLFEAYLSRSYSWFLNKHSADLGKNILSEVSNVTDKVLAPFINLVAQCSIIIIILSILLFVNAKIALISFSAFGLGYYIIYLLVSKKLKVVGINNIKTNKQRAMILMETFGAIKEVKIGSLENIFIRRYDLPAVLYAKGYSLVTILSLMPKYAMEGLGFGSLLLVIIYLVSILDNFQSTIPILAIYAIAAYRILPAIQQLYTSFTTIKYSQSAVDLLYNDLNEIKIKNKVHYTLKDKIYLKKEIKLKNLNFKYPFTEKLIFKNLNMSIKANTSVAFIGKTGSGKTTLADIIIGLLEPHEGKLFIDDQEINTSNIKEWQKLIGYVPQQVYLSDDSIINNIAFGVDKKNINIKSIERSAKIANIYDFINNELPNGFETVVGERGVRLSGGQKQRIGIARALYFSPQILVLDEATSALDSITERSIMKKLKEVSNEMTIIIIAHRLNTVENCDIIYILENGSITESGSYDDLKIKSNYFKQMTKK